MATQITSNRPHHQLAGASAVLTQIVNEAQHQLAVVVVAARQMVNVIRNHRLPPDCVPGKTRVRGTAITANLLRANRSLLIQLWSKPPRNNSVLLAILPSIGR